jgi:hypothetical protein
MVQRVPMSADLSVACLGPDVQVISTVARDIPRNP